MKQKQLNLKLNPVEFEEEDKTPIFSNSNASFTKGKLRGGTSGGSPDSISGDTNEVVVTDPVQRISVLKDPNTVGKEREDNFVYEHDVNESHEHSFFHNDDSPVLEK